MIVEVELNAFQNGKIRPVEVDPQTLAPNDINQNLERVFVLGQNDFQPVDGCCSVSMGDVIRFNGKRYEVAMFGFEELPSEDDLVDEIKDGMEQMKELKNEILEGGF